MIIRLRAASRAVLEAAFRQFGVLQPDGIAGDEGESTGASAGWRPARGISLVWLGRFKIGEDILDPETGDVVTPAPVDPREHVDLLVTGPALTAAFHDAETGQSATMAAVDALLLIWATGGTAVETTTGMETALSYAGIELIEDIRTPRHVFAGVVP
ncbi:hypothetical protein SAMN06273572_10259 [Monaibacterium marinum]|uniref:Uncharacterized protein n=1 Tax=Pontivivens marinum TaxID=1690039 RepID=A0A2C9CQ85_9RHOB|nr:hypothetical protein [Monaibacterium marinum]SOH93383.1 hypothetical protein SAMN06273572_10259 [Monaibacterium marinum]